MKKIKVISFLMILALLTGCQKKEAAIKKPPFANYKKNVTYGNFITEYNSLVSPFAVLSATGNDDTPSFTFNGKRTALSSSSHKRSGDNSKEMVLDSRTVNMTTTSSGSYDNNNFIFEYKGTNKTITNNQYYNKEMTNESAVEETSNFQLEKNDKEPSTINIFNKSNHALSDSMMASELFAKTSSIVATKSLYYSSSNIPTNDEWELIGEQLRTKYRFYVDDGLLTMIFKDSIEVETKNIDPSQELNTASETKKDINLTIQFSVKNDELKYMEYYSTTTSVKDITYIENKAIINLEESTIIQSIESSIKIDSSVSLSREDSSAYYEAVEKLTSLYFI